MSLMTLVSSLPHPQLPPTYTPNASLTSYTPLSVAVLLPSS